MRSNIHTYSVSLLFLLLARWRSEPNGDLLRWEVGLVHYVVSVSEQAL